MAKSRSRKSGKRRSAGIGFIIVIAIALFIGLVAPDEDTASPKDMESMKVFDDHGFKYFWADHSKNGQTYYLANPSQNILVTVGVRRGRPYSYTVRKTEGNMQTGLYMISESTGERERFYYVWDGSGICEMDSESSTNRYYKGSENKYKAIELLEKSGYFDEKDQNPAAK